MAKSVKQLQDELVNDSFLDKLASERTDFADLNQLPSTKQIIILSAANFIQKVQEELQRLGKVSSGNLEDGITSGDLIEDSGGFEIDLGYQESDAAAKYFDYVNKGVAGYESGQPSSPYSFKSLKVSKAMVKSLLQWYRKRGNAARNEDQKKGLSATQRKNKSLKRRVDKAKQLQSLAYATAVNIKKKGIKKTGFFDRSVEFSFGKGFIDAVAKTVGQDIKVYIRQIDKTINQSNNR